MVAQLIFNLFLLLIIPSLANATTLYVRTDGGTGSQCTGQASDAYDAGAHGTACALNHPNWTFPPAGESSTRAAAVSDTVIIYGSAQGGTGEYRIGCQNAATCRDSSVNLTVSANCNTSGPGDCLMGTIPNSVTVIGCSVSGCGANPKPILWGAGIVSTIINLTNKSNVTISDLEITDHSTCARSGPSPYNCNTSSSSEAARDGITITGATNPTLTNLNIHGLGRYGVFGGSVAAHTFTNLNVYKNPLANFNFDSCGNGTCPNTGEQVFDHVKATYAGCVEAYPVTTGTVNDKVDVALCFDQNETPAGYGDGIGWGATSGNVTFTDSDVSHNASDGVDLLYHDATGTFKFIRSRAEGNVGNAIKSGMITTYIENSLIVGNCGYFGTAGINLGYGFTSCRTYGEPIAVAPKANQHVYITNSTVWGRRTLMAYGSPYSPNDCNGSETIDFVNSILYGADTGAGGNANTFACGGNDGSGGGACCTGANTVSPTYSYSDIYNTGNSPTGTGVTHDNPRIGQATTLSSEVNSDNYNFNLTVNTPASVIGQGNTGATCTSDCTIDYNSYSRGASWDMGALEYGSGSGSSTGGSYFYNIKFDGSIKFQ